jgi:hypothetical protein
MKFFTRILLGLLLVFSGPAQTGFQTSWAMEEENSGDKKLQEDNRKTNERPPTNVPLPPGWNTNNQEESNKPTDKVQQKSNKRKRMDTNEKRKFYEDKIAKHSNDGNEEKKAKYEQKLIKLNEGVNNKTKKKKKLDDIQIIKKIHFDTAQEHINGIEKAKSIAIKIISQPIKVGDQTYQTAGDYIKTKHSKRNHHHEKGYFLTDEAGEINSIINFVLDRATMHKVYKSYKRDGSYFVALAIKCTISSFNANKEV